jgi:hypothetical protein
MKYTQTQADAMAQKLAEILDEEELKKLLGLNHTVGPLAKSFVPKDYFRDDNREVELYVYDSFETLILPSTGKVSKQPAATLASYDFTETMYNYEIRAELPKNHVFAIADLWMIDDLIKNDKLLKNSWANLFYFQVDASVLVVSVRRFGPAWRVRGWSLGEHALWGGGLRVFSRNS